MALSVEAQMAAKKMGRSQAAGARIYARYGKYRYEVQAIKVSSGASGLWVHAELKVLKAERTGANEEHKVMPNSVGAVISYSENLDNEKKGGGGRFLSFLVGLVGMDEQLLGDEDQKSEWTSRFYDTEKCAGTFLLVDCEVTPRWLKPKDGKPGRYIEGMQWQTVDLSDDEIVAIDAKRKALELCSVNEVIEFLKPPTAA
jgi:hypothetical protein